MKKVSFTIVLLIMGFSYIIAQNAPKSGSCPGMPQFTDPRDGKTYNTVQIGDRCWMKENLNIGTFVNSAAGQLNNNLIEKFCYQNTEANCVDYGGLYQWNEMMQYTTTPGIQGICPDGWRIPNDDEWCALATALDATVNCNQIGMTGTDAGGQLKEAGTAHWNEPNTGATNLSDFTGLPGGYFTNTDNTFSNMGCMGIFHTSSSNDIGRWAWQLSTEEARVSRVSYVPGAFSVRCIRDANWTAQLSVTPANQDVSYSAGTTTFDVTSNISWTVEEVVDWLSVAPTGGSNNGTLTITYDANAGSTSRIGEIIVTAAGEAPQIVVTVTQLGQQTWACGQNITDARDGKTYGTIQIGNQCWMKQNLNIGTRINGTSNQTNNGTIEKFCYNNLEANCDAYGGLYQWNEMMNYSTTPVVQGICMTGWHLPTDVEWCTLTSYIDPSVNCTVVGSTGTDAGGKMKEAGFAHWNSPNTGATNSSGFTGLPGGYRTSTNGGSVNLGRFGDFWSSSQYNTSNSLFWNLDRDYATVQRSFDIKTQGFSIRCLKD